MPRAGLGRCRSSPRAWRTVTGPSSSALPARAWTSAPEPGNRRPGRRPKPPPRAGWSTREYAAAYAVMKWPLAAAHTRAGIADALATITPALLTPERGGPPAAVLRAALYGHAFNPAQAGTDPGPAAAAALAWASHHCLPLTALAGPQVTRRALGALALRLDGTRAAATTITRKRAVFGNCLGSAAELGLLAANPLDHITWRPPRSSCSADPRSTATPAEVQAILAEVTRIRPELTAFFGCLYYAALRPAEAVALRVGSCALPSRGWGQLTLTASLPRSARAWTGNGTPREPRSLKHRPEGAIRTVPIPPQLARLLRWHLRDFGCAEDGRLFRGARGAPLSESLYGRIWHQARAAAMPEDGTGAQPVRRPYDLRHAALSLGWPPAPRLPRSLPAPGTACVSCSPSTPTACPAATRSPASTSSKPSAPAVDPRSAHNNPRRRRESVRHAAVPQLDSTGHSWTRNSAQIRLDVCDLWKCRPGRPAHGSRPRTGGPGHPFSISR